MNAAGNAINHPERMKPDQHVKGSPLPRSVHSADVGYLADGTDLKRAGNNFVGPARAAVPKTVEARGQLRFSFCRGRASPQGLRICRAAGCLCGLALHQRGWRLQGLCVSF